VFPTFHFLTLSNEACVNNRGWCKGRGEVFSLPEDHAVKVYEESGGKAPPILSLVARWR
jgi:hypothetical protein